MSHPRPVSAMSALYNLHRIAYICYTCWPAGDYLSLQHGNTRSQSNLHHKLGYPFQYPRQRFIWLGSTIHLKAVELHVWSLWNHNAVQKVFPPQANRRNNYPYFLSAKKLLNRNYFEVSYSACKIFRCYIKGCNATKLNRRQMQTPNQQQLLSYKICANCPLDVAVWQFDGTQSKGWLKQQGST